MRTVIFDFDGVIHNYKSGWKGAGVIPDPIVPGIDVAIKRFKDAGYKVVVCSSRCCGNDGVGEDAIRVYLAKNNIDVDDITDRKVPAVAIIDDRAIRFDGNPSTLFDKVNNLTPWMCDDKSKDSFKAHLSWVMAGIDNEELKVRLISMEAIYDKLLEEVTDFKSVDADKSFDTFKENFEWLLSQAPNEDVEEALVSLEVSYGSIFEAYKKLLNKVNTMLYGSVQGFSIGGIPVYDLKGNIQGYSRGDKDNG
jgi:hypothetical protein